MRQQEDQLFTPELAYELEVYNAETNQRLGHLGDMNEHGIRLVAERTLPRDQSIPIRICLNRNSGWREHVTAKVTVESEDRSSHPERIETYLRFLDPSIQLVQEIQRLSSLSETPPPDASASY